MTDEKNNSLSVGQAIDLIIKNAEDRLITLETKYDALMTSVSAICKKLNYTEEVKDDTAYLAEKNKVEKKEENKQKRKLTPDMIQTENTSVDWQIRILGEMGSSLILARYEYEQLMEIISSNPELPYKDEKWSIIEFANGLIKICKIGKDGRDYFCLI